MVNMQIVVQMATNISINKPISETFVYFISTKAHFHLFCQM